MALDLTLLKRFEYDSSLSIEQNAERLRIILMPWLYFSVENGNIYSFSEINNMYGMLDN